MWLHILQITWKQKITIQQNKILVVLRLSTIISRIKKSIDEEVLLVKELPFCTQNSARCNVIILSHLNKERLDPFRRRVALFWNLWNECDYCLYLDLTSGTTYERQGSANCASSLNSPTPISLSKSLFILMTWLLMLLSNDNTCDKQIYNTLLKYNGIFFVNP